MLIILLVITISYVAIIGSFIYGFDKVDDFILDESPAKTQFSVVIPFRNETQNLNQLLYSISELNYPNSNFEIIFVNDASEDNSEQIINSHFDKKSQKTKKVSYRILQNIRQSGSPKKDAISLAVEQAKFDWIVSTDADCILPKFWLDTFDAFIQKNQVSCVVAPVCYETLNSFLNRFQNLDMLSLQGATIGGFGIHKPFLCNGANLGYSKIAFEHVNGYEGNDHISSGDDIFLVEKFLKRNPSQVKYLKSGKVIVRTKPQPDFRSLVSQRLRWAAKTSGSSNLFGKLTALVVFTMNGALVCTPLFYFAMIISLKTLLYIWLIKIAIDFLLLFKTVRFFEQENALVSYLFSSLFYPPFCVYVAIRSIFSSYKWKGRSYKR